MQLLYVANRYEKRAQIERAGSRPASWSSAIATSRRASPTAKRRGSIAAWLTEIQRFLPPPDLTILLDIAPETAVRRKAAGRDRYERDLALLSRVRASYRRQAAAPGWLRLDGERAQGRRRGRRHPAVATRLALP